MLGTDAGPAASGLSFAAHAATLHDRHVVITGVSGGIGRAVAAAFAESGARVIGLDRTAELAAGAVEGLPHPAGDHAAIGVDLEDSGSIAAALGQVRSVSKDVAALVNVAGFATDAVAQMVTQDALRTHMQVNFFGAVQVAQYVSRLMVRTGGGSIVNISSVTGLDGNPGQLAYGAAKAALNNATRILSMELAPRGIRVNAVAPGVVDTAMTQSLADDARAALLDRVALGRMAIPAEVATVVLWLCTPAASYVTGQVLRVDGGMSA